MIPHPPKTTDRVAALLPPCFFAPAIVAFAGALVAAPFLVSAVHEHFYQARVLALVHTLTLGWVSMVMIGVLYRHVAGLTKRPVPFRTSSSQASSPRRGPSSRAARCPSPCSPSPRRFRRSSSSPSTSGASPW